MSWDTKHSRKHCWYAVASINGLFFTISSNLVCHNLSFNILSMIMPYYYLWAVWPGAERFIALSISATVRILAAVIGDNGSFGEVRSDYFKDQPQGKFELCFTLLVSVDRFSQYNNFGMSIKKWTPITGQICQKLSPLWSTSIVYQIYFYDSFAFSSWASQCVQLIYCMHCGW